MSMNFAHQIQLFDPRYARPIVQIVAGAVGSWATLFAAKAGVTDITLIDDDVVESHNTPMSLFGPGHVGMFKVEAVASVVKLLTGVTVKTRREMYLGGPLQNATVISSVDLSIPDCRRKIWKAVCMNPTIDLYCDTRTAGLFVEAYANEPMRKEDIENYEGTLFDDKDAVMQTCGRHGMVTASARVADGIVSNILHFWEHGEKKWRFAERCDILSRADYDYRKSTKQGENA